jgi:hypothetical protein
VGQISLLEALKIEFQVSLKRHCLSNFDLSNSQPEHDILYPGSRRLLWRAIENKNWSLILGRAQVQN